LFLRAAEAEPNNPNLYYYLADCYVKTNHYGDAKYFYHKTVSVGPVSPAATMALMAIEKIDDFNRKYSVTIKLPGNNSRTEPPAGEESEGEERGQGLQLPASNEPSQSYDSLTGTSPSTQGPLAEYPQVHRLEQNFYPSQGHYLDRIAEEGLYVRWPDDAMPLKVFIERKTQGTDYAIMARKAIKAWADASDGKISYVEVTDPEVAQIRVYWTETLGTKDVGGQGFLKEGSTRIRQGEKTLYQEIKVATLDFQRFPNPPHRIYHTLVHEFGHALGLRGHSDHPADVMYATKTGSESGTLSQRDINTIRELYWMEIAND
jgi:hypothetical protein